MTTLETLTAQRANFTRAAMEAEDRMHTNAFAILIATALAHDVTDLILIADDSDDTLRPWATTIDYTTHKLSDLPANAWKIRQAAMELPAFTQHSFTDYLTDLPHLQTDHMDHVPMRVDLARAATDYGIPA